MSAQNEATGPIAAIGGAVTRLFQRVMPDPFVLAVLLTLLTALLALMLGDFGSAAGAGSPGVGDRAMLLLDAWRADGGLWKFLAFAMQMCLILVTGHAVAASPPVRRVLDGLAAIPGSTVSAAALVAVTAGLMSLINWGLCLIVGAIMAREAARSLSRRGIPTNAPLLAAAGYTGMMIWHGGLSGSAPLSMTSAENAAKVLRPETMQALTAAGYADGIPLSATLASPLNLVVTGGLLVLVPLTLALLAKGAPVARDTTEQRDDGRAATEAGAPNTAPPSTSAAPFADKLDRSPIISWLIAAPLLIAVGVFIAKSGLQRIGLNEINAAMLGLGLLLHGSPRSYLAAAEEGARGCMGIIIQFPLYAGIMAMMAASGLIGQLSGAIVGLGGATTAPLLTFFSAGIVNLFVPSGGGQWGVQGPIAIQTALDTGIDPGRMVMAVAFGDQLTNMLQPFWALPLLAITGVKARDIVGYTAIVMLVGGVFTAAMLLIL